MEDPLTSSSTLTYTMFPHKSLSSFETVDDFYEGTPTHLLQIVNNSRFGLDLPEDTFNLVKILDKKSTLSYRNIVIVLKK